MAGDGGVGRAGSRFGLPSYAKGVEIRRGGVELGEGDQGGTEFFHARCLLVIGDTRHPGFKLPEVAGVVDERIARKSRKRDGEKTDTGRGGVAQHCVDEAQAFRRRMLGGPAAENERLRQCGVGRPAHNRVGRPAHNRVGRPMHNGFRRPVQNACGVRRPAHNAGNSPELGTAHSAGRAERLDPRRSAIRRVFFKNGLDRAQRFTP